MNAPHYNNLDITPTQVAQALLELSRELAEAASDFEELEKNAVDAENVYGLAREQKLLLAGEHDELRTADARKAWAYVHCHNERIHAHLMASKVRARKVLIDTLKTRVTIGQTVANALQSEIALDGVRRR